MCLTHVILPCLSFHLRDHHALPAIILSALKFAIVLTYLQYSNDFHKDGDLDVTSVLLYLDIIGFQYSELVMLT